MSEPKPARVWQDLLIVEALHTFIEALYWFLRRSHKADLLLNFIVDKNIYSWNIVFYVGILRHNILVFTAFIIF